MPVPVFYRLVVETKTRNAIGQSDATHDFSAHYGQQKWLIPYFLLALSPTPIEFSNSVEVSKLPEIRQKELCGVLIFTAWKPGNAC